MNPATLLLATATEDNFVSFPNLGLKFEHMSRTVFRIGSFELHWYGLIICLGMILCVVLGFRFAKKYAVKTDDMLDYLIVSIPAAIVGARIYYVLFQLDYYKDNPAKMFAIWEGGLAIYGGIIATAIALFIATKVKKKSFLHILDFALPYIMLGQAIGRWGNFVNQEAYGRETTWLFGMTGNLIAREMGEGVLVHPTFLYESLWCLLGFIFLAVYRSKWQTKVGEMTALYMIVYGAERAVVEGLRTDSLMLNIGSASIRVSQWLSVVLVVLGIALFIDVKLRGKKLQDLKDAFAAEAAAAAATAADGTGEGVAAAEPEEEKSSLSGVLEALEELEKEEKGETEDAGENDGSGEKDAADGAAGND